MQFSLASLFLITTFIGLLLVATFGLPVAAGVLTLLTLSAFVLPPFVIIGVIHTRGIRQSFFIGAMVSGIPHYLFTAYAIITMIISSNFLIGFETEFGGWNRFRVTHLVATLFGCFGGLTGMAAYYFFKKDPKAESLSKNSTED